MKALRFSKNIENDIARNFSCYMGMWFLNKTDAIKKAFELNLDENDVGYDEYTKMYGVIHHKGLSCFECDSLTDEEIIEKAKQIKWEGSGEITVGKIEVIENLKDIDSDLYLLEINDYLIEN